MIGAEVGSYRIVSQLGAGGMGVVYLAEHTLIGRKAAIKVLLPEFSRDEASLTRFFNEARSTALIRHAGLVDVFDFGYHDGAAYIAMELLDGESLGARLRREQVLPAALAAALARQVAAAVGAAHARGIVHRDLKPDNVFLVPDPEVTVGLRVKVLDFGIAKLGGELGGVARTTTGNLLGTPLYMSPEQCRGAGAVDHRADVYSLGCMLFEMLCGRPPFVLAGVGELISAHMNDFPPRLATLAPGTAPELEALVMALLEKRPEARPQTMEEVVAALAPATGAVAAAGAVIAGWSRRGGERAPGHAQGAGALTPGPASGWSGEGTGAGPAEPRAAVALSAAQTMPSANTTLGRSAVELVSGGQRRAPWPWLGLGAVIVGLLAVVVIVSRGTGKSGRAGQSPSPSTSPSPNPSPSPGPTAPSVIVSPVKVKLKFESVPPGASVFRVFDGVNLCLTPCDVELVSAPGSARFELRRRGFRSASVVLAADKDGVASVRLKKAPMATSSDSIGDGTLD
ncbi:MAG: serine/threonine protein kinase [Deltaproteobacteria bacterium]|nr:serine/threonine protein kinase [Deltaproteobacteria bacterium]